MKAMLLLLAAAALVSAQQTIRCGQTVHYTVRGIHGAHALSHARTGFQPHLVGATGMRVTLRSGNCVRAHQSHANRGHGVDTYISAPCRNDDTHGCGVGAQCAFTARTASVTLQIGCYSTRGCSSYLRVICAHNAVSAANNPTTVQCGHTYRYTGTGRAAWRPHLTGALHQRVTLLSGRCVPGHSRDPDTYISGPCHNDDACSTGARCIFTATSNSQALALGFFSVSHRYSSYLRIQCSAHSARHSTGPTSVRCGQTVRYTAFGRGTYTTHLTGARGRHVTINTGACVQNHTTHRPYGAMRQPNGQNAVPDTYFTYPCHVDDVCGTGARCAIARVTSQSQILRLGCYSTAGCTAYLRVVCDNQFGIHTQNGGPRVVRCGQTVRYTATGRNGYQPYLRGARGRRVTISTGQCARNPIRGLNHADSVRRNWWIKDTYNTSPCRNDDACGLGAKCRVTITSNNQRIEVGCYRGRCSSYLRITCAGHGGSTAGASSSIHSVCWDRMGTAHCNQLKNVYQCSDTLMLHGCLETCGFCRTYTNPHAHGRVRTPTRPHPVLYRRGRVAPGHPVLPHQ